MWGVEEQDDGSNLLCIELPLLPVDTTNRLVRLVPRNRITYQSVTRHWLCPLGTTRFLFSQASVDCIFDETLVVSGEPVMTPGLSGTSGKA